MFFITFSTKRLILLHHLVAVELRSSRNPRSLWCFAGRQYCHQTSANRKNFPALASLHPCDHAFEASTPHATPPYGIPPYHRHLTTASTLRAHHHRPYPPSEHAIIGDENADPADKVRIYMQIQFTWLLQEASSLIVSAHGDRSRTDAGSDEP